MFKVIAKFSESDVENVSGALPYHEAENKAKDARGWYEVMGGKVEVVPA